MNSIILPQCNINKLPKPKQREVEKAFNKLINIIEAMGDTFYTTTSNNIAIHDSYGKDLYLYKYLGPNKCSLRLLYRYHDGNIELHKIHFKHGDRDNSAYINKFEEYVKKLKN